MTSSSWERRTEVTAVTTEGPKRRARKPAALAPPRKPAPRTSPFRALRGEKGRATEQEPAAAAPFFAGDGQEVAPKEKGAFYNSWPLFRVLYDILFCALFLGFAPFNDLFSRRRRAPRLSRPLRVLRMTSPLAHGGVAKVAVQTVLAMSASQAKTTLLAFGRKQSIPPVFETRPDVEVRRLRLRSLPTQHLWALFRDLFVLAREIRRLRPDVIHVHEPQFAPSVVISAGLAGGVAVVAHLHSLYQSRRAGVSRLLTAVERRALRRIPLVACSPTIATYAREWIGGTRRPIAIIQDGTDDVPTWPADERLGAELAEAAAGRMIVCKLARIIPLKRIEDFLSAGRALLDEGRRIFVLLVSYGENADEAALRSRFNRLFAPEEGEFLFHAPFPQHLLKRVGVGVSASSLEGLGLNILEFQVEGVPVVCTDIPAHREMVVDGETGLLFEPGNAAALTNALRRLLDDPALRERLGQAGREAAQRRRWADTAARTIDLYRSVLGRSSSAHTP